MSTTPPDTQPPPTPGPDSGPRVGWDDIRDLGRIRRTTGDRRVAGVAGGLARHLDIDPLIVRVAFVVLTFFGGVGLLLYLALLAAPARGGQRLGDGHARPPQPHGRPGARRRPRPGDPGSATRWWGSGYPWALLIVAGLVALVADRVPAPRPGARPPPRTQRPSDRPRAATRRRRPDPAYADPPVVRRAAATGEPAQEGADPVLVRPRP